jgi:DNA replication and repair protein RecF
MLINEIYLRDFRNYEESGARFFDGINVIAGDNAQGKTNLIEAIYYVSAGRSFRARADRDVIRFGARESRIRAGIMSGGRNQSVEIVLAHGRKKRLSANGVALSSAAEMSGRLSCVVFCPEDLNLIRNGAAGRRRLLDMCLCQMRPRYAAALTEYNRLYEHKTRILRDYREKPSLLDTLDDFNAQMAKCGALLIWFRASLSALLCEKAAAVHRDFSGGAEELQITYKTVKTVEDTSVRPEELLPALLEHQRTHRQAEIDAGLCLSGVHKDDLEVEINGIAARSYASQGQARTAALSLKLAEREIHREDSGEYPVLLLDDVLSELDAGRQSFVLERIRKGQIFITCCEYANIGPRAEGGVIRVRDGRIY